MNEKKERKRLKNQETNKQTNKQTKTKFKKGTTVVPYFLDLTPGPE